MARWPLFANFDFPRKMGEKRFAVTLPEQVGDPAEWPLATLDQVTNFAAEPDSFRLRPQTL
jgi:hypothetical protein